MPASDSVLEAELPEVRFASAVSQISNGKSKHNSKTVRALVRIHKYVFICYALIFCYA